MKHIQSNKLVFLGFLVLKQIRYQDNIEAIKAFNKANIKVLLVSEERELETSSIAILNQICEKKELLLCSITKAKNKI
jgi:16S rRNA C1402 (ribose-2'-O) methylase RsmI